jgi:hypothetical protein
MAMFKAFKPSGMEKIARSMGYQGNMQGFQDYLATNPAQQQQMELYTNKAMQMAKGGYAKNKKVKYFKNGGGTEGDGPTDAAKHYFIPDPSDHKESIRIRVGSRQDTAEARSRTGYSEDTALAFKQLKPYEVRVAEYEAQKKQGQEDLLAQQQKDYDAAMQRRKEEEERQKQINDPSKMVAKGIYKENPRPDIIRMNPAVEAPDGFQYAYNETGERITVPIDFGGWTSISDSNRQQQKPAITPEQQQQQYSQQVAAQMQNRMGGRYVPDGPQYVMVGNPPATIPNDPLNPKFDGRYVPDGRQNLIVGHLPATIPNDPLNPEPATYKPSLPPIYQAPYLSGTRFTPVGQYVQDPNTGQPVAQAYTPLNQGYGAAATNFQQQIQGGYGTNTTNTDISETTLTQNRGGYVEPQKFAVGGSVTNPAGTQAGTPVYTGASPTQYTTTPATYYQPGDDIPEGKKAGDEKTPEVKNAVPGVAQFSVEQMYNPALPVGGVTIAAQTQTDPRQNIATGTGELTGQVSVPTATATTAQAQGITPTDANVMQAAQAAPGVDSAMNATQAAQANPQDPRAQITAAQQTASSVGNLQAAQGNASLINNPVQRQIQSGELISGVADAQVASQFTEQIQAAQATPSQQATVQGQLSNLMQQFQGGNTPAWAAGAMRSVTSAMAARGLSASSLAGQAMVQAAMESALPIAQADAQTQAQFEGQNLSNRQQRAMLAAQQRAQFMGQEFDQAFQSRVQNSARIGDIANMNFTAEQQVQLENSRAVNTMNLNNLSNSQAMVMAEAAALAQLDTANLSNRQQSAVQNAQNFLSADMANLSNRQQTELFKAQQRVQSLFTDQAATNAAAQFNATSQNQVDQFFASLGSQVSQFNATQQNAQAQFNAGQTNTVNRFNAELNNQRDQFNAQNQLVIAQSNAQWRRQIATADTAAVNRANELNANAVLDISKNAYDNLWTFYGDTMEWAWKSAENQIDRVNALAIAELDATTRQQIADEQSQTAAGNAVGSLISTIAGSYFFGMCWVAREVYGKQDVRWLIFRTWLKYEAPKWLNKLYEKHGENFAEFISDKPALKWVVRKLMDKVVANKKPLTFNTEYVKLINTKEV